MRRRRFLGAVGVGIGGSLGGCASVGYRGDSAATRSGTPSATPETVATVGGVDLPVPSSELRAALPRDSIPAIVEPEFASDWSGLEAPPDVGRPLLPEDAPVIGVSRAGRARAYPLRILDWHEVVNDTFGGPLLVTYCVLCGSGVVAERLAGETETTFGVSGRLWRKDLVLYDERTESLWSQLLAAAIRGPLTGERLSLVPSSLTTWGEWRRQHPDGRVLLPPPRSNTVRGREATFDYFDPKYDYGDQRQIVGYDSEGELADRTLVLGVEHGGVARAYPFGAVREAGVVNDRVGGLPVVVTVTPGNSMAAYSRRVEGDVLRFEPGDDADAAGAGDTDDADATVGRHMRAGGSRWERATGRATDGPYADTRLDRATDQPPMFWVGWSNFHPDTDVYG